MQFVLGKKCIRPAICNRVHARAQCWQADLREYHQLFLFKGQNVNAYFGRTSMRLGSTSECYLPVLQHLYLYVHALLQTYIKL